MGAQECHPGLLRFPWCPKQLFHQEVYEKQGWAFSVSFSWFLLLLSVGSVRDPRGQGTKHLGWVSEAQRALSSKEGLELYAEYVRSTGKVQQPRWQGQLFNKAMPSDMVVLKISVAQICLQVFLTCCSTSPGPFAPLGHSVKMSWLFLATSLQTTTQGWLGLPGEQVRQDTSHGQRLSYLN